MERYQTASLRTAASRVRALRIDDVIDPPGDLDDNEGMALAEAIAAREADNPSTADPHLRQQADHLLGLLGLAAEDLVEMLRVDLRGLRTGVPVHDELRIAILGELPPQFLSRYDVEFTERFVTAAEELRGRLGGYPWHPPSCVAHELGLRLVLDRMQLCADICDIDLREDWRAHLEDLLFHDLDHELLYDPEHDGFEHDPDFLPGLRLAPMRFEAWFDPFDK